MQAAIGYLTVSTREQGRSGLGLAGRSRRGRFATETGACNTATCTLFSAAFLQIPARPFAGLIRSVLWI